MKRIVFGSLILLGGVLGVLGVRTLAVSSRQVEAVAVALPPLDLDGAADRLAAAIRFPTVAADSFPEAAFTGLQDHLIASYPRVHRTLGREVVAGFSLLYTWPGRDPGLPPIVLMAHQDVVPVEPGTEGNWEHPPFSGARDGEAVWGRGALDVKEGLCGILEAVEFLLSENFTPERTILLVFGHNEETAGDGAPTVARLLESRGIRAELVLDEGLAVTQDLVPGVRAPVALVGIAEKGEAAVDLRVETRGGHSAMPPDRTAAGLLGAAVAQLEEHPFPSRLDGPGRRMFEYLAPEMALPMRLIFSNLWLFQPLVLSQLVTVPSTNALVRTTTAVTRLESGVEQNVLPARGWGVADFRILPGDSIGTVLDHVRGVVGSGVEVTLRPGSREPSPVSPVDSDPFRMIQKTVREVFPEAVLAPGLVLGGTDSRHFTGLSDHVYRFLPIRVGPEDLGRIHGDNERILTADYHRVIGFYLRLIRNASGPETRTTSGG